MRMSDCAIVVVSLLVFVFGGRAGDGCRCEGHRCRGCSGAAVAVAHGWELSVWDVPEGPWRQRLLWRLNPIVFRGAIVPTHNIIPKTKTYGSLKPLAASCINANVQSNGPGTGPTDTR
jgi:hypothetical protein